MRVVIVIEPAPSRLRALEQLASRHRLNVVVTEGHVQELAMRKPIVALRYRLRSAKLAGRPIANRRHVRRDRNVRFLTRSLAWISWFGGKPSQA
jgi:hypothetical protein